MLQNIEFGKCVSYKREIIFHMKGCIFNIQHFCTHDGPGVRTTVFLKGCSLSCSWCHNPESKSFSPEVLFNPQLCISCGLCDQSCPENACHAILSDARKRIMYCEDCFNCQEVCPSGALELAGKMISVEEILSEVVKDKEYYLNSGGGITVSGEPLCQPDFLIELLQRSKEAEIGTVVETSGNGSQKDYSRILPYVDNFWDVKIMEPELYRCYTGGSLNKMLDNLSYVAQSGARIRLRLLFIPQIHLREDVLSATVKFLSRYPVLKREVIPYHLLGNVKRKKLGLPEVAFREPNEHEIMLFKQSVGCVG